MTGRQAVQLHLKYPHFPNWIQFGIPNWIQFGNCFQTEHSKIFQTKSSSEFQTGFSLGILKSCFMPSRQIKNFYPEQLNCNCDCKVKGQLSISGSTTNSLFVPQLCPRFGIWGSGLYLAWILRPGGTFHPQNGGNRGIVAIWGFFLSYSGKPHCVILKLPP